MLILNKINKIYFLSLVFAVVSLHTLPSFGQVSMYDEGNRGSVYISVGGNAPSFGESTIDITQGNSSSFSLSNVKADNKVTSKKSGLPYNIRVGYFFDYYQTFAVELSYDPVKYHATDGQIVRQTGTMDNRALDTSYVFSAANGYFYNVDGANMLSINIVKRFQLFQNVRHTVRLDALAKLGGGAAMPHVYNSIGGKIAEYPSFQLGGWNVGGAAAVRLTIMRHVFLEGAFKYNRVSYTDIGVYNGTAKQKVAITQFIGSIGYTFSTTRHNPLFEKPEINYWPITIKPIHQPQVDESYDDSPEEDFNVE